MSSSKQHPWTIHSSNINSEVKTTENGIKNKFKIFNIVEICDIAEYLLISLKEDFENLEIWYFMQVVKMEVL